MEDMFFEMNGDDELIVKYKGKLNIETSSEYEKTIKDAVIEMNITSLVLDFEETEFISSIGIRVLLELNRFMFPPKKLSVRNLSEQVSQTLRMSGILGFFNVL